MPDVAVCQTWESCFGGAPQRQREREGWVKPPSVHAGSARTGFYVACPRKIRTPIRLFHDDAPAHLRVA